MIQISPALVPVFVVKVTGTIGFSPMIGVPLTILGLFYWDFVHTCSRSHQVSLFFLVFGQKFEKHFFSIGMGTMSWTITSEIYPLRVRSICSGISTSANWFFNLAVSLTFLTLTDALSAHGAYFLYAGITLSGFILFYKILPET